MATGTHPHPATGGDFAQTPDAWWCLDVDDDALTELARDGFDPQYGARPLRRSIQNLVEDAVAEQMLEGKLRSGGTAHVRLKDGKVVIESESAPADAPQPEAAPAK